MQARAYIEKIFEINKGNIRSSNTVEGRGDKYITIKGKQYSLLDAKVDVNTCIVELLHEKPIHPGTIAMREHQERLSLQTLFKYALINILTNTDQAGRCNEHAKAAMINLLKAGINNHIAIVVIEGKRLEKGARSDSHDFVVIA